MVDVGDVLALNKRVSCHNIHGVQVSINPNIERGSARCENGIGETSNCVIVKRTIGIDGGNLGFSQHMEQMLRGKVTSNSIPIKLIHQVPLFGYSADLGLLNIPIEKPRPGI